MTKSHIKIKGKYYPIEGLTVVPRTDMVDIYYGNNLYPVLLLDTSNKEDEELYNILQVIMDDVSYHVKLQPKEGDK